MYIIKNIIFIKLSVWQEKPLERLARLVHGQTAEQISGHSNSQIGLSTH